MTLSRRRSSSRPTARAHQEALREGAEDYRIFLAYLRDSVVRLDSPSLSTRPGELGDDGWPLPAVSRTPYQQLWIQWVLLEDLCAHLVECPEIVEEVIGELMRVERQVYQAVRRAADRVTAAHGRRARQHHRARRSGRSYFRRYCVPLYNELADLLADKGTLVFVHMDGDLKPLWKQIGESRVRGIDSLSPPPDNDTSVGQAHALWPDDARLRQLPLVRPSGDAGRGLRDGAADAGRSRAFGPAADPDLGECAAGPLAPQLPADRGRDS